MPDVRRHEPGNVVLHEFLHRIRQVRKPFVAPFVVPFDDLDARALFGGQLDPLGDLLVGGSGSDEILEVLSRDFRKSEEEVIKRTTKVIFGDGPGQSCSALVQCLGRNNVTGWGFSGTSGVILSELLR
jgi:hypothetical protein